MSISRLLIYNRRIKELNKWYYNIKIRFIKSIRIIINNSPIRLIRCIKFRRFINKSKFVGK